HSVDRIARSGDESTDQVLRVDRSRSRVNRDSRSGLIETRAQQHGSIRYVVNRGHEGCQLSARIVLRRIVVKAQPKIQVEAGPDAPVILRVPFEVRETVVTLWPAVRL